MNITNYLPIIITILLILLLLCVSVYYNNLNLIRVMAYDFIVKAEMSITGNSQGKERMKFVIERIRFNLPWYVKVIFTEQVLELIIQYCFDIIKYALNPNRKEE